MIIFDEHCPAFIEGYERKHIECDTLEELCELEKGFLTIHKDLIWACDYDEEPEDGTTILFKDDADYLMVSCTSEEWWWVVGYVKGIKLADYLPRYDEVFGRIGGRAN